MNVGIQVPIRYYSSAFPHKNWGGSQQEVEKAQELFATGRAYTPRRTRLTAPDAGTNVRLKLSALLQQDSLLLGHRASTRG